jgi:hypothetical protein
LFVATEPGERCDSRCRGGRRAPRPASGRPNRSVPRPLTRCKRQESRARFISSSCLLPKRSRCYQGIGPTARVSDKQVRRRC